MIPKEVLDRITREADELYGKCHPNSKDYRTRDRQKAYEAGAKAMYLWLTTEQEKPSPSWLISGLFSRPI